MEEGAGIRNLIKGERIVGKSEEDGVKGRKQYV